MAQEYSLAPNPNDGNMHLMQAVKDDSPVEIKVYNALGASVYSSYRLFDANMATLSLSTLAPGVYNVVIHDKTGSSYVLRFVKK